MGAGHGSSPSPLHQSGLGSGRGGAMGVWRGLRLAFVLGSLFMILLIIAYWDDVGGANLYPLRRPQPACARTATPPPPPPANTTQGAGLMGRGSVEAGGQERRRQRIADVCAGHTHVEFSGRSRPFDRIPHRELDHLIVDDTHQIIYCYVPKVACTNWKRVLVVLAQSLVSPSSGKPYTDPESIPPDLVHNSSLHLTFAKFWQHYGSLSRHLMALKLQHYTKFLFVRDPFVRLISAFRNKFGKPNQDFYKNFGSVMLSRYGNLSEHSLPATVGEAFAAGLKPTFQQFVSYLLDPETEKENIFNEHWRQVYRLCHPCQVKYDFIGHLETLDTDADHLLKLLKVDPRLRFPSGARNQTAASWGRGWFAQVPMDIRRKLYELYQPDFELFGYPTPDSVLQEE